MATEKVEVDVRRVFRTGRSFAVIIPMKLARQVNLREGDLVEIICYDNAILITPVDKTGIEKKAEKIKRLLEE